MEDQNFSHDDARVALMEYGHDRSGHDRPVEEIVQIWADDPRPPLVQLKHVSGLCMEFCHRFSRLTTALMRLGSYED